ncbi:MAG TPA: hypothetical protein VJ974_02095 [Geopsychrobacteraceae bacterium]|nr:hypothetical protein [Geopsychrobacteraceae bacterium]
MNSILCFLFVLCLYPAYSLASNELNGHVKSFNLYQQSLQDQESDIWLSANSLRLDLTGEVFNSPLAWQLSLEQLVLYHDPKGIVSLPDWGVNRITDLSWNGDEQNSLSWQLQADRLSLQWDRDDTVFTIGRQGIGFGRISLFSPLDIIAPFSPASLDTDVRPGVDALRARYFFNIIGEAGGTLVFSDEVEKSSALIDVTFNFGQMDVLMIGGQLRNRPMVGFGLAGQLGSAGWKGEWSGYRGSNVGSVAGDLYDKFSIAGVELEYRFYFDLNLQVQYLYNGAGSRYVNEYPLVAQSAPLSEGLSFLYGKDYLLTGLSRDLTPLIRLSGLLIFNLNDDSWLFRPQLNLSLADNVSLELLWNITHGDGPLLLAGQPVIQSEYGAVGESGGVLLKYYF